MDLSFVVDQGAMARVGPELRAHLRRLITSPRVLRTTGPGNEIPFYLCPFAPEDQVRMEEECRLLIGELEGDGVPVLEINLYDLMIGLLREQVDWEELAAFERAEPKSVLLEELQSTLNLREVLIPRIRERTAERPFRVLFLTGVGEVFPVIRSHLILNNLQSVLKDAPTIIFFPGRYAHGFANGSSLQVLCRLEEDHYYRAHNLLHMREANILKEYREDRTLSIADFADRVSAYIGRQEKTAPGFRLNFFVDEVGQYIADNVRLMTNLQTIAESLNTRCRGRAWIVVTAQQEMDTIIGEMNRSNGNDFSKIMGRFDVKLPLNAADVAEVIQERLLLKKPGVMTDLGLLYDDHAENLRTLFEFGDGTQTMRGFRDRDHFIRSYPFHPYQYELFQKAIRTLSDQNAFEGRHTSTGERSMLGAFQEVGRAMMGEPLGALATFDRMFEGVRSVLKASAQHAILSAERQIGEQNPFAVRVLKALFLVKYVDEFKPTARNVGILMRDRLDLDPTRHKREVEAALALLEQESYVQRNGDFYEFLTDEEKDIEQKIKAIGLDASDVTRELSEMLFGEILGGRKAITHEGSGQTFPFTQRIHHALIGREHPLAINLITPYMAPSERGEATLATRSITNNELLIVLREESWLVDELAAYLKTKRYLTRETSTEHREGVTGNGYLTPMVVSLAVDRTRPEILDQAAAGSIPDHVRAPVATRIRDLLEGRAPSREPQVEAYRLLLVAACNDLSRVMPFLFEAIADYTELLMPNELLAADGWVTRMREVMTEDACQDVEIIGWLYQFYISEKKDQVFAGLKKNQKITAENIPAATQLFTPHWIVRYLVENSLGRLWLLNRPGSRLAERMDYYIAPEEPETDFLRISGPQEIRICDPACGSGHMLTYAFDLLYAIYEEEGLARSSSAARRYPARQDRHATADHRRKE